MFSNTVSDALKSGSLKFRLIVRVLRKKRVYWPTYTCVCNNETNQWRIGVADGHWG